MKKTLSIIIALHLPLAAIGQDRTSHDLPSQLFMNDEIMGVVWDEIKDRVPEWILKSQEGGLFDEIDSLFEDYRKLSSSSNLEPEAAIPAFQTLTFKDTKKTAGQKIVKILGNVNNEGEFRAGFGALETLLAVINTGNANEIDGKTVDYIMGDAPFNKSKYYYGWINNIMTVAIAFTPAPLSGVSVENIKRFDGISSYTNKIYNFESSLSNWGTFYNYQDQGYGKNVVSQCSDHIRSSSGILEKIKQQKIPDQRAFGQGAFEKYAKERGQKKRLKELKEIDWNTAEHMASHVIGKQWNIIKENAPLKTKMSDAKEKVNSMKVFSNQLKKQLVVAKNGNLSVVLVCYESSDIVDVFKKQFPDAKEETTVIVASDKDLLLPGVSNTTKIKFLVNDTNGKRTVLYTDFSSEYVGQDFSKIDAAARQIYSTAKEKLIVTLQKAREELAMRSHMVTMLPVAERAKMDEMKKLFDAQIGDLERNEFTPKYAANILNGKNDNAEILMKTLPQINAAINRNVKIRVPALLVISDEYMAKLRKQIDESLADASKAKIEAETKQREQKQRSLAF